MTRFLFLTIFILRIAPAPASAAHIPDQNVLVGGWKKEEVELVTPVASSIDMRLYDDGTFYWQYIISGNWGESPVVAHIMTGNWALDGWTILLSAEVSTISLVNVGTPGFFDGAVDVFSSLPIDTINWAFISIVGLSEFTPGIGIYAYSHRLEEESGEEILVLANREGGGSRRFLRTPDDGAGKLSVPDTASPESRSWGEVKKGTRARLIHLRTAM